jgi:hypothetical protein
MNFGRSRLARAGLTTAFTLMLVACGGETDPADAADAMVGTYTLESVDGDRLPATSLPSVTITGGEIELHRDRSYVARIELEDELDSGEDVGTWILNGAEVILSSASSSSSETLLVSDGGRVLTLDSGVTFVFLR